jgi:hypothetical protein
LNKSFFRLILPGPATLIAKSGVPRVTFHPSLRPALFAIIGNGVFAALFVIHMPPAK